MSYRGRFAPSPTGVLHFGSLVAAVGSWLVARHHAGAWLLRVEDIDPPREVPGSAQGILDALPAFGLEGNEPPTVACTATAIASPRPIRRGHRHGGCAPPTARSAGVTTCRVRRKKTCAKWPVIS
jgi:hypothetical protein